MNISSSSGAPSTVSQPAPTKKLKSTASHPGASSTQVGSPAVPALVVSTKNVELHTASQSNLSSSSSASATSAASRLRRADLARAKLELAKARTQEAEALLEVCLADDEVAAGSQTGTVGRLEDVQSEVGSTSTPDLLTDGALRAPPTLPDDLPFAGVFVQSADSVTTPTIYDVFSKDRGVHIINDILLPNTPQVAVRALSSQDGVSPPTLDVLMGGDAFSSQDGSSSRPKDVSMLALSSQDGALQSHSTPDHEMGIFPSLKQGDTIANKSATFLSFQRWPKTGVGVRSRRKSDPLPTSLITKPQFTTTVVISVQ